jgi:penicillin-binding protein 1C
MPYDAMAIVPICRSSGSRATDLCQPVDSAWIPKNGLKTAACPYHQLVHLDKSRMHRVTSNCMDVNNMVHEPWFVLPAVQEYYYKSKDPTYRVLPPFMPGCDAAENANRPMELIYPKETNVIYIPIELDQKRGVTVFQVAHRKPGITIFWHLDGSYLGSTRNIHQMGLAPDIGEHVLTLVDEDGYTVTKAFKVMGKKKDDKGLK